LPATIADTAELLRTKALSPIELTQDCLARIERLNPSLNAFITVTAESAIQAARQAESEIMQGQWRGPLHGIPLALKDIIDVAGVRTTAASAVFKNHIPEEDAEVVRLLKAAGAILLGKQNLHEFAYGGSSTISDYGPVHNPWNQARIAGGSSGGSASAVAAGLCCGALGTDTAGSIREPAALCGVVGLKPTYGRVSTRGIIPLSQSFDHAGPITRNVSDAAVILDAISGSQPSNNPAGNSLLDSLSRQRPPLRVGIPRTFFCENLDPEVLAAIEQALEVITSLAAEVKEISLAVNTDRTLQLVEAFTYHAQFIEKTPELYQPETLRRVNLGSKVGWQDYTRGLLQLKQDRQDIAKIFETVDMLVTPTTPIPAPSIVELQQNPDLLRPRELLLLRNTRPFNVWGLPTISVPCGFTRSGLPIGLQIAGPHWNERSVLQLAHAYEQATTWHNQKPM